METNTVNHNAPELSEAELEIKKIELKKRREKLVNQKVEKEAYKLYAERNPENKKAVEDDILRYKKNKLASALALLGLVFSCLYFCILYAMPAAEMRKIVLGVSIVITLVLLLLIFLSSEGVKGYNKTYSIALLAVAVFQVLRIFYYPLKGLKNNWFVGIGYFGYYPDNSNFFFTMMLIWLVASAACLAASAVIGWIYAVRLEKFQKNVDSGAISIEKTLAEVEAEDEEIQAKLAVYREEAEKEIDAMLQADYSQVLTQAEEQENEQKTQDVQPDDKEEQ